MRAAKVAAAWPRQEACTDSTDERSVASCDCTAALTSSTRAAACAICTVSVVNAPLMWGSSGARLQPALGLDSGRAAHRAATQLPRLWTAGPASTGTVTAAPVGRSAGRDVG